MECISLATVLGTPTHQPANLSLSICCFQVYLYKIVTCFFHIGVGLPGSGQIKICTPNFRPEVWRVGLDFSIRTVSFTLSFHNLLHTAKRSKPRW